MAVATRALACPLTSSEAKVLSNTVPSAFSSSRWRSKPWARISFALATAASAAWPLTSASLRRASAAWRASTTRLLSFASSVRTVSTVLNICYLLLD